jgi:hypothetical protein
LREQHRHCPFAIRKSVDFTQNVTSAVQVEWSQLAVAAGGCNLYYAINRGQILAANANQQAREYTKAAI